MTELQWEITVRKRHGETGHVSHKEPMGDNSIKEDDERKIGEKVNKIWLGMKKVKKKNQKMMR